MSTENQTQLRLLSFRNGFYQGELKAGKRYGKGVLITDLGQIIIGSWKNDMLEGHAFIFLNEKQFGFMDFSRGDLEGYTFIRNSQQMLFIQFNSNKPIGKQLLINFQDKRVRLINYRSPAYEVIESYELKEQNESFLIQKYTKVKYECMPITEYLSNHFMKDSNLFELKSLSNGHLLFKFVDGSNPLSLGFMINKNEELVGYGLFCNDKLHGIGCKFENNVKYQGIFQNGFLNGMGMKHANSKFSFGRFDNGNLVDAIYLQERSHASEDKLKELKRLQHIKSLYFHNSYIRQNIIKFNGISEINFQAKLAKQYLYPQSPTKKASGSAGNNNLNLKLLNKTDRRDLGDDFDKKSSKTALDFNRIKKNPEDFDLESEAGKSNLGLSSLRKYKL